MESFGPPRLVGWYRVAAVGELPPGAVLTRRLFGRDVVLFRTASGTPHASEPICPHLGAHLGHGGRVEGETLRCPFHGFRFDGRGTCVATEHCKEPPARASLRTLPVVERADQLFVYDGLPGEAPRFELPALADDGLSPRIARTLVFRGRVEDFAENGVDLGHFGAIHNYRNVRDVRVVHDGPRIASRFRFDRANPLGALPRTITSVFDTVIHGLGFSVTELHVETLRLRMQLVLLATQTEVDEVAFTISLAIRTPGELGVRGGRALGSALAPLQHLLLHHVLADVAQDRAIWAHRVRLSRPALAPEDAEIGRFRRYLEQFAPSPA